ncbi:hypothetical protein TcasGA2_TC003793 [Tribolium castaneum]|uniref:Uncharacterized protein n=1 Tax=Tribolium castaneum TaxID=7070 RepID=D6WES0_TRICA|nr:hypothetical protein TcasGA2_TC003793 [Tribolium castaneum]
MGGVCTWTNQRPEREIKNAKRIPRTGRREKPYDHRLSAARHRGLPESPGVTHIAIIRAKPTKIFPEFDARNGAKNAQIRWLPPKGQKLLTGKIVYAPLGKESRIATNRQTSYSPTIQTQCSGVRPQYTRHSGRRTPTSQTSRVGIGRFLHFSPPGFPRRDFFHAEGNPRIPCEKPTPKKCAFFPPKCAKIASETAKVGVEGRISAKWLLSPTSLIKCAYWPLKFFSRTDFVSDFRGFGHGVV